MQKIEVIENKLLDIPPRYRGLTFDDFKLDSEEQRIIMVIAKRFVATFEERLKQNASLIFTGSYGTGKTMLAMIIHQALIQKNYSVYCESIYTFLETLEQRQWQVSFAKKFTFDNHMNHQLLILDNFTEDAGFSSNFTPQDKRHLFSVIDDRYKNNLNTLLISSYDKQKLTGFIGQSCMDRLLEAGVLLDFNWESYRTNESR